MKQEAYRHGEICLLKIDKLPKGLKSSNSKIIVKGSHGNDHSIDNGKLYFKSEGNFIIGYLVAKNTNLLHAEHKDKSGKAKISDGVYEIRKQQEFTPSGLVPIID